MRRQLLSIRKRSTRKLKKRLDWRGRSNRKRIRNLMMRSSHSITKLNIKTMRSNSLTLMRSRKTWPLSNTKLQLRAELSHHSTTLTGTTKWKDFTNRLFLVRSFSQARTNSIAELDGHPSPVQPMITLVSRRIPTPLTEWLDRRSTVMSMESISVMSSTMV